MTRFLQALSIVLGLFLVRPVFAVPQYYCTASNAAFYNMLLNLIGSIHATNYDSLQEIAVFDLGLDASMVARLNSLSKVTVYKLRDPNPQLLTFFSQKGGKSHVLGAYAWKPVVIKEALEKFPYLLYLDAGNTVFSPLDDLFEHIANEGYFFSAWAGSYGDPQLHLGSPNRRHTTRFVSEAFHLDSLERNWILDEPSLDAGAIGVSQKNTDGLIEEWAALTCDMRYFLDDGSCPEGWGYARHDQTLFNILVCLKGLDYQFQDQVMRLRTMRGEAPFVMNEVEGLVPRKRDVARSRGSVPNFAYHVSCLRAKGANEKR